MAVAIADHKAPSAAAPINEAGAMSPGREIRPVKRDRRGAQSAERDLAFGANVDDARAEAEGDS